MRVLKKGGSAPGHILHVIARLNRLAKRRSRSALEPEDGELLVWPTEAPDELAAVLRVDKHAVLAAHELLDA